VGDGLGGGSDAIRAACPDRLREPVDELTCRGMRTGRLSSRLPGHAQWWVFGLDSSVNSGTVIRG
jgi:hypothetical protein